MWPFRKKPKDITEPVHTLLLLLQDHLTWRFIKPVVPNCTTAQHYTSDGDFNITNGKINIKFSISSFRSCNSYVKIYDMLWLTKDEMSVVGIALFALAEQHKKEQLKEQRKQFSKQLGLN